MQSVFIMWRLFVVWTLWVKEARYILYILYNFNYIIINYYILYKYPFIPAMNMDIVFSFYS